VRLLLDEMISYRIAAELRSRGHDVEAIKRDRPELESIPDQAIVATLAAEERVIVTNDVDDFQPIHQRLIRAGKDHAGMVFTYDETMPRNKRSVPLWVTRLEDLLASHPADDALKNRVHHLV
jgi:predicted nuclease of predicted toxin-antitoxin system